MLPRRQTDGLLHPPTLACTQLTAIRSTPSVVPCHQHLMHCHSRLCQLLTFICFSFLFAVIAFFCVPELSF